MAIVRKYGRLDLFITMTCNSKWPELKSALKKFSTESINLEPSDVPMLVVRIFQLKLKALIKDITYGKKIFGPILSYIYTIEFQKRGLPHAHILVTLQHDHKFRTADQIDSCISAEIPPLGVDNVLGNLVIKHMLHGPHCENSPCLDNERKICKKNYPKRFFPETILNENGFPSYRRRDNTHSDCAKYNKKVKGKLINVNNSMVVPFNPYLLKTYDCHINVEYCTSVLSTKYIHKYIHKGHDRAHLELKRNENERNEEEVYDEIREYIDSRYVSPTEAAWRILEFPIAEAFQFIVRINNLLYTLKEMKNQR